MGVFGETSGVMASCLLFFILFFPGYVLFSNIYLFPYLSSDLSAQERDILRKVEDLDAPIGDQMAVGERVRA